MTAIMTAMTINLIRQLAIFFSIKNAAMTARMQ